MTFTYQARPRLNEKQEKALEACSRLLNNVERSLHADVSKGSTPASNKNSYLKRFGITARHFNSCRVNLDGKIAACKTSRDLAINSLNQKIKSVESQIKQLKTKPSKAFSLHQKKRRHEHLSARLKLMQKDKEEGRIRLCFGSKKLFRAQFHLKKNGFANHQEWKKSWKAKRNSEFFFMGSKDETSGNQSCVTTVQEDGSLRLRLRLPPALETKHDKYCVIENVRFAYGHDIILAAIQNCSDRKQYKNKEIGQSLSFRFKKDKKGWRLFVSTDFQKVEQVSQEGFGAIGIDINADHIACVETDRFGNPVEKKNYSWNTNGKKQNQLKALTGGVCKEIIDHAKRSRKPVVVEDLNFQKKKNQLQESHNKRYARMLSSFAYSLFLICLIARAYKYGIAVHKVNPAFTSVIGRCNYSKRYGLSIHLAAALCIARRHQKFSEKPCLSEGMIPDGKGNHVALSLPVRNRQRHVWHFWGLVKRKLSTVLAAHFRAIKNRSLSPPRSTHETGNLRLLLV